MKVNNYLKTENSFYWFFLVLPKIVLLLIFSMYCFNCNIVKNRKNKKKEESSNHKFTKKELFNKFLLIHGGEKDSKKIKENITKRKYEEATKILLESAAECCNTKAEKGVYLSILGIYYEVYLYQKEQANSYYQMSDIYCEKGCETYMTSPKNFIVKHHIEYDKDEMFQKKIDGFHKLKWNSKQKDKLFFSLIIDDCILSGNNCDRAERIIIDLKKNSAYSQNIESIDELSELVIYSKYFQYKESKKTTEPKPTEVKDTLSAKSLSKLIEVKDTSSVKPLTKQMIKDTSATSIDSFSIKKIYKKKERILNEINRLETEIKDEYNFYQTTHESIERLFRVSANDFSLNHNYYEIQATRYNFPKLTGLAVNLRVNLLEGNGSPNDQIILQKTIDCLNKTINRYQQQKSKILANHKSSLDIILPTAYWESRSSIIEKINFLESGQIHLVQGTEKEKLEFNIRSDNIYEQDFKEWELNDLILKKEIRVRKMRLK